MVLFSRGLIVESIQRLKNFDDAKSDRLLGNLSYALTARNFNPVIAMAGETVITDADHIVPIGVISPDHVVTPAPIVDYLIAN